MEKKLSRQIVLDRTNMAPWRKDLPEKFLLQIARKEPFQVEPLKDYLQCCNSVMVSMVKKHIEEHGPLRHPKPGEYEIAEKECTDARSVTMDLDFLLKYPVVNARIAGNIIRKGAIFKNLKKGGVAIVKGHRTCGACAAAHSLVGHEKPDIDANLLSIITSIPFYVRAISEHRVRDPENAKIQATYARRLLKLAGREDIYVYPSFYDWTNVERPFTWLREHIPQSPCTGILTDTAQRMTQYARAEGRNFEANNADNEPAQYAMFTLLADSYRLGRISDPRAIFGELGNGIFCVSLDMRPFDPSPRYDLPQRVSSTAIGSVMYAGYDKTNGHYGHVAGVGRHGGTHILGLLDVCPETLRNAKSYLIMNYPLLTELTEGGKRILLMLYDKDAAKVTFIDD